MSEYWRDFATNTAGRWFTVIFGDLSGSQVLIHLMHTLFILYCSWSLIKMPRGLQSNVSLAHCLVHHYHFYQLNQRETSHSIFHELMQIGINYIFLSLIAHGLPQTRTNRYHPAHHWQHPSDSSLATECVFWERRSCKTQSWSWARATLAEYVDQGNNHDLAELCLCQRAGRAVELLLSQILKQGCENWLWETGESVITSIWDSAEIHTEITSPRENLDMVGRVFSMAEWATQNVCNIAKRPELFIRRVDETEACF